MAQVQNVNLDLSPNGSTVDITVSGSLEFASGELGTKYRLEIELFAVEEPGEGFTPLNPRPLYTFRFGSLWNSRDYVTIAATKQNQPFKYDATVSNSVLDEDPGGTEIFPGFKLPHEDEIRAVVTLSKVDVAASSVEKIRV